MLTLIPVNIFKNPGGVVRVEIIISLTWLWSSQKFKGKPIKNLIPVQLGIKYMKMCPTSLAIKEMQIKTALRLQLTPVRMAMFKGDNNKCW
jgi:hypothetical protein